MTDFEQLKRDVDHFLMSIKVSPKMTNEDKDKIYEELKQGLNYVRSRLLCEYGRF